MNISPKSFDPETLAKLSTLTLRARHAVEGYVAGLHRSPSKGQSIEFSEHREYSPGDDLRLIDWKAYGRSDRYYVKQFEDESNLIALLGVDYSESMAYRGDPKSLSKLEYAQLAAITIAYYLLGHRDSVSLATYADGIQQWMEPSNHPHRWLDMIPLLESSTLGKKTDLGRTLGELSERLQRRSLVILISDFFDDLASIEVGLRFLKHQRHDLLLLQVLDRAELSFPFRTTTTFDGLEGAGELTLDPMAIRSSYLEGFSRHQKTLRALCHQLEFDMGVLVTDQSLAESLPPIVAHRQHERNQRGMRRG